MYVYNGILLSHKKNKTMPFAATWMQQEIITLIEVSQKEKYHMISHAESKIRQMNLSMKQEKKIRDRENRLMVAKEGGIGDGRKVWD